MKTWSYPEALERLKKYCAQHEQCTYKVQLKLQQLQIPSNWHTKIIEHLRKEGFLDDERFAELFVESRFKKNGWGKNIIKWALLQLQIDPSIIDAVLNRFNAEDEKQQLHQLLQNKFRTIPGNLPSLKKKQVLFNFAARKGYDYSLIWECLDNLDLTDAT